MEITELLGRKFCIFILLEIAKHPGATKSEILGVEEGNARSKFLRIGDLVEAGLVQTDERPRKHNTVKLYLTPLGQEVCEYLKKVVNLYEEEMKK
ncbi:hypothetical protein AR505_0314 [methanogenic archaeon ISO4-H5]|nr:hypothetical protein AR505_0314 [methanogenic archaeon ISO4-H5]